MSAMTDVAIEPQSYSRASGEAQSVVLPTLANIAKGTCTQTVTEHLQGGKMNWFELAWITGFDGLGIVALLTQPFKLAFLPVMVAIYLWLGFSVTLYLHRHLTHKSFELNAFLKFFYAMGSAVGFAGDPVGWVSHHRHHHKHSDTIHDVHSPRYGFWFSHVGWFLRESHEFDQATRNLAADCRNVWYLRLLENRILYGLPHFAVAAVLYFTLGLPGLLYCLYLPLLLMHHHTWAINSLTHKSWMGYRRFDTDDDSVNSPFLLGALGEGWHNNHHANARRAAAGLAWYEIDLTKYLLWGYEKLGLAWDVHWT
ncbi:MAG: acyl-CoA desaturase [Cyanobacteria bacterium REEB65]|nr:acyl-CoA desaturase [Cyanobacteria bacterium REEB65]